MPGSKVAVTGIRVLHMELYLSPLNAPPSTNVSSGEVLFLKNHAIFFN